MKGPPRRRRLRDASVALMLGLLATLVLLEGALRVAGVGFHAGWGPTRNADFTVLCVGDSFTFGMGAPQGKDWPRQLENALRETGIDAIVVNHGILSATTSVVKAQLATDLASWRPDVILLLAGNANLSDYRGFFAWREGRTLSSRAREALWDFRIWRFLRFTLTDLRLRRLDPGGAPPSVREPTLPQEQARLLGTCPNEGATGYQSGLRRVENGQLEEALAAFQHAASQTPRCVSTWLEAARTAHALGRPEEAARLLQEGWKANPTATALYDDAEALLPGDGTKAAIAMWLESWIAAEPDGLPQRYAVLASTYETLGRMDRAIAWYHTSRQFPGLQCSSAWGEVQATFRAGNDKGGRQILREMANRPMPGCTDFVGMLSSMCSAGLESESVVWFEQAIAYNHREWFPILRAIQPCITPEDLPRIRRILQRVPERGAVEAVLREIEDGQSVQALLAPWTRSELAEMARMARFHGIPVLLGTYPNPSSANPSLRTLAAQEGLPLIDHERRFQAQMQTGIPRSDLFTDDGNDPLEPNDHCNEYGYGLMADEVLTRMRDEGLLP